MNNFKSHIQNADAFPRLQAGDLLFAEYNCPLDAKLFEIWSERDYFIHVLSGKKTWHTSDRSWVAEPGSTFFFKKGAAVIEQDFDADFCILIFFLTDSIVREVVQENTISGVDSNSGDWARACAFPLAAGPELQVFIHSIQLYFAEKASPPEPILRLKLKELILSVLLDAANPSLKAYLLDVAQGAGDRMGQIMRANFRYRLSMEEFAQLCGSSLSKFKRDFQSQFGTSPGRWLIQERLNYAARLLRTSPRMNITEIAFDSGFEDVSHFSKAFRQHFGDSPTEFRNSAG